MLLHEHLAALEKLIADWDKEAEKLAGEPEYDGGYADALLMCAGQLHEVLHSTDSKKHQ